MVTGQIESDPAEDDAVLREARMTARHGNDDSLARQAMAGTRDDFDRRALYVRALAESTARGLGSGADRSTGRVDTDAAWTDRWAAQDPESPDAQVLRARSLVERAWQVRGAGWASTVRPEQWAEFGRVLRLADQVNDQAIQLAPKDPTPWVTRLTLLNDASAPKEDVADAWQELISRDPWHREGHKLRMTTLCRKWRGSHEQMFGFARSVAEAAPAGSPLHVLPVRAAAEWALWEQHRESPGRTPEEIGEQWRQDKTMQADLDNALSRWFHRPAARHADWLYDVNFLAYGLARCGRDADAAPVFASIGKYATRTPWTWWDDTRGDVSFIRARRRARRAA